MLGSERVLMINRDRGAYLSIWRDQSTTREHSGFLIYSLQFIPRGIIEHGSLTLGCMFVWRLLLQGYVNILRYHC
jgi:hypothetical protein